jgi:hypothetical protein
MNFRTGPYLVPDFHIPYFLFWLRSVMIPDPTEILFLTAPSSKNVCRSLGLTQRRHLPDPLKVYPLGPTGPVYAKFREPVPIPDFITYPIGNRCKL